MGKVVYPGFWTAAVEAEAHEWNELVKALEGPRGQEVEQVMLATIERGKKIVAIMEELKKFPLMYQPKDEV